MKNALLSTMHVMIRIDFRFKMCNPMLSVVFLCCLIIIKLHFCPFDFVLKKETSLCIYQTLYSCVYACLCSVNTIAHSADSTEHSVQTQL